MPRLIWSTAALSDVQGLYQFLSQKDEAAARRDIKTIRAGVKLLAYQPGAGRPIDGMETIFREWPGDFGSSGYSVLYGFDGETATILAVRHKREAGY